VKIESITIRDGRQAELVVYSGDDPPPYELRARIRETLLTPETPWISYGEQVHLTKALAGQIADQSSDYYYIALLDDEVVATTWVGTGKGYPEVGNLGSVYTVPKLRQQGLAWALTVRACADFDQAGGKALYLATGNPGARRIYERAGFAAYNGNVMRRLSPATSGQQVDEWLFGRADRKQVRPAHWGDLARATALFTRPHPWLIKDYREGIYSHPELPLQRCNSIFIAMMLRSTQPGACLLVLENPASGILGTASITPLDGQAQSATAELEVLVAPEHGASATLLLEGIKEHAGQADLKQLLAWVAACDEGRRSLLEEAGFVKQAELPGQFVVGDQRIDLQLLLWQLT